MAIALNGLSSIAYAQETVTLKRYEPASNGWVIVNPQIRTDLVIVSERTKQATVRVNLGLSGGTRTGYKYNGTIYSESNSDTWCPPDKNGCLFFGDVTQAPWGGEGRVTVRAEITYKGKKVASLSEPLTFGGATAFAWSKDVGAGHRTPDYAITNIAISSTKDETTERLINDARKAVANNGGK